MKSILIDQNIAKAGGTISRESRARPHYNYSTYSSSKTIVGMSYHNLEESQAFNMKIAEKNEIYLSLLEVV